MLEIYTDGGFKTTQQPQDQELVSFTSAFWCEDKTSIQKITIPRTPTLKSYANLSEFYSIKLAVEYAIDNYENHVLIKTDSKTCVAWIKAVKVGVYKKKKRVSAFATIQHQEIFDTLVKLKDDIDIDIEWLPRNRNIVGIILEERGL